MKANEQVKFEHSWSYSVKKEKLSGLLAISLIKKYVIHIDSDSQDTLYGVIYRVVQIRCNLHFASISIDDDKKWIS